MKRSSWLVGVLALALLAPGLARADGSDKIFVLKNGRKIRGELLDETASSYVVGTESGGRVSLAKGMVDHVEDAPPPAEKKPEADTPAPAPSPTPRPDASASAPTTPAPAAPAPRPARSAASSGGPSALASDADIASVRRALVAVPKIRPEDPEGSAQERKTAIAKLQKEAPLGALVAIVAFPEPPTTVAPPTDRELALELVLAAGEKARPLIARAIREIDPRHCEGSLLFETVKQMPGKDDGTLEKALVEKLDDVLGQKLAPDFFTRILDRLSSTTCLPPIYKWILETAPLESIPALESVAEGILAAAQPTITRFPDPQLDPLIEQLPPTKLPAPARLETALVLLGYSKGAALFKVSQVLDTLELMSDKDRAPYAKACTLAYKALGNMSVAGMRPALDRLLRSLSSVRSQDLRVAVVDAIGHSKPDSVPEIVNALADSMAMGSRPDAELEAYGRALELLTGKQFGTDVDKWRDYAQSLR